MFLFRAVSRQWQSLLGLHASRIILWQSVEENGSQGSMGMCVCVCVPLLRIPGRRRVCCCGNEQGHGRSKSPLKAVAVVGVKWY